jgi:hypothetical protein
MSKRNPVVSMTLAAGALVAISVLGAYAQVQTGDQQKCLNAVNKDGAAVAKTQGKEHLACVKGAGKGTVADAQACLTADVKGKVAKAKGKTSAAATKSCTVAPSFGFTGAAAVNTAAQDADVDLVADVYGANLTSAIISCTTNKAGCGCQQKISKSVESLAAVKFATFVACKKAALKAGANSSQALKDCVENAATAGSIAADTKGKIAKSVSNLNAAIVKSCQTPAVTAGAFPGKCTGLDGALLGTCLDTQVECRVCTAINEMDGLFVNCDLFDNGIADASCESGTGPTPTPSTTPTPTPTATATFQPGTIFKGTLPRTSGNWNYMLNPGQPGGEALCNATFAGTHVCTIANLQAAQGLGELVGASDNAGAVIRFWKVDPLETNLRQCINDTGTLRWQYGTAHTLSKGIYVNFTSGTGTIGAESGLVGCPGTQASVGCCL